MYISISYTKTTLSAYSITLMATNSNNKACVVIQTLTKNQGAGINLSRPCSLSLCRISENVPNGRLILVICKACKGMRRDLLSYMGLEE